MAQEVQLIAVIGALVLGIALLGNSAYQKTNPRNGFALLVSTGMAVNFQYGVMDIHQPVLFFIGLYDPLTNLGISDGAKMPGLSRCPENSTCSALSDSYDYHQGWATDFYSRFVLGPVVRRAKLYAHIYCNTGALILGFFQFQGSLRKSYPAVHRYMGWMATVLVLTGVGHALWLASEHGDIESYGENWAILGWCSMAFTVLSCLFVGVRAAMHKDFVEHEKWMTRWYGAMFGAFLVFRVIFLLCGPLFRSFHPRVNTLFAVYVSSPLGVAIAEWQRLRFQSGKQHNS